MTIKYEVWVMGRAKSSLIEDFDHRETAEEFIEMETQAWLEFGESVPEMWIVERLK